MKFRFVSWNINYRRLTARHLELIRDLRADVLALQEVSAAFHGELERTNLFAWSKFSLALSVPDFEQPVHVFVAHLKAFSDADSAAKHAAEASAVSNFFVTQFLVTYTNHPYALVGDLNEDINRPPTTSAHPIERLVK